MTCYKSLFVTPACLLASTARRVVLVAVVGGLSLISGCHSAFVQTTLVNHSGAPLRLVEVGYPSASFGTTNLNPDAEFHYRFKIQGSGSAKLDFVDLQGKTHHAVGPELDEGQEGSLVITIDEQGNVHWAPTLITSK